MISLWAEGYEALSWKFVNNDILRIMFPSQGFWLFNICV